MKRVHFALIALMIAGGHAASVSAQDYNYVPGWTNTHNHRYKGSNGGDEWPEKTALFAKLSSRGPAAQCTLANLSDADGNVIVNQYRRQVRRTNERAALQWAHQQVEAHHRQLKASGKC